MYLAETPTASTKITKSLKKKKKKSRKLPFSGVMISSQMVSASGVVQVVKPHPPLTRFPDRRDDPKPSVSEVLRSAALPSYSSILQHAKRSKSPDWLMLQGHQTLER